MPKVLLIASGLFLLAFPCLAQTSEIVADVTGDVDVPCVDLEQLRIDVFGASILAIVDLVGPTAARIPNPRTTHERVSCTEASYELLFDIDMDGQADESAETTIGGGGIQTLGLPSLLATVDQTQGRIVWQLDSADLGLSPDQAHELMVQVRAVAGVQGLSPEHLNSLRDEDLLPEGWKRLLIPAVDDAPSSQIVAVPARQAAIGTPVSLHARLPDTAGHSAQFSWTIVSSDPDNNETIVTDEPFLVREFDAAQELMISLEADVGGVLVRAELPYSILGNLPPIAIAEPPRSLGTVLNDNPYFCQGVISACRSKDVDGEIVAIEFLWGDGRRDLLFVRSGSCAVTHTFLAPNLRGYEATVVIYDDGDGSDGVCSNPVTEADLLKCRGRLSAKDTARVVCPEPTPR